MSTSPSLEDQHHGYALAEVGDRDHEDSGVEDHQYSVAWPDVARIAVVALGATLVWFSVWEPFARVSVIGIIAAVVGGWPIFREAYENIVERRMAMELSMSLALFAALAIG